MHILLVSRSTAERIASSAEVRSGHVWRLQGHDAPGKAILYPLGLTLMIHRLLDVFATSMGWALAKAKSLVPMVKVTWLFLLHNLLVWQFS